jgi:signal transduction histidine kinase
VATIDRASTGRPAVTDGRLWRAGPAGPRPARDWFEPEPGLRPAHVDVVIALGVAVLQVAGTIAYSRDEAPSPWAFDVFAFVLLVAGPVALLFRRHRPEATLVVAFAAAAGYAASGYPRGPAGFPAFLVALVGAVMLGRRAWAWGVLVVAYAAFVWLPSLVPDEMEDARSHAGAATTHAWLPLVGAGSEIARLRLERRAERADAEREEARRRASEERLRIARELHDVLAHNISLINVQSGVALHLLDERPEQARPALEAINMASEQALGELHSVLDVLHGGLRDDPAQGVDGAWAPRTPTAGLGDIEDLVRRTRTAGLDVDLTVEGETGPVPAGQGLAVFRIVQESLTNVVRHAGGDARATVRLVYAPAELTVQVDDDGRGVDPTAPASTPARDAGQGAGRGLTGMRERVHALGGTFTAGPRPGRGFGVRARFPLQDGPR